MARIVICLKYIYVDLCVYIRIFTYIYIYFCVFTDIYLYLMKCFSFYFIHLSYLFSSVFLKVPLNVLHDFYFKEQTNIVVSMSI